MSTKFSSHLQTFDDLPRDRNNEVISEGDTVRVVGPYAHSGESGRVKNTHGRVSVEVEFRGGERASYHPSDVVVA